MTTPGPISGDWTPGGSACLRAKEFLTGRHIPFVSVNLGAKAGAMGRMATFAARNVPAIEREGAYVYPRLNADIVAILALNETPDAMRPPAELDRHLDVMLRATLRYLPQVPEHLLRDRDRDFFAPRALAQHIFRTGEAFLEMGCSGADYSYDLMMRSTLDDRHGNDITGHGRAVIARLTAWRETAISGDFTLVMATYYSPKTRHQLLERAARYAAQHTRQLRPILDGNCIKVDGPLRAAGLGRLPLPRPVWSKSETETQTRTVA